MGAIRKLRKCAKFVASLCSSRKSKKQRAAAEQDSAAAIRCIVAVSSSSSDEEFEFEFDVDPDAIKRGCHLVYPVFGREISEFNGGGAAADESAAATAVLSSEFGDRDGQQSSEETEGCQIVYPILGRAISEFRAAAAIDESAAATDVSLSESDDDEESDGEIDYCSWEPDLSTFNVGDGDHHQQSSTDELETSGAGAAEEFEHCLWKPKLSELSFAPPVEIRLFEIETVCSSKKERNKSRVSCRRRWPHLFSGRVRNLAKGFEVISIGQLVI